MEVLCLGRSGRHVCVADTESNRERFDELREKALDLERDVIASYNAIEDDENGDGDENGDDDDESECCMHLLEHRVQTADATASEPGAIIVDVWCAKCGSCGSSTISPDDVDW